MCVRSRRYSGSSMRPARLRGRGSLTSTISASRASGPLVMSAMRSDNTIASSTSCVTMNTVLRLVVHIRTSSSWMTPRVSASIWAKGSSSSNTFGSVEKARASPTRCRMPPESAAGRFRSAPREPDHVDVPLDALRRRPRGASPGAPRERRAGCCRIRVIHGMSEKFWNTTMRSIPGRRISRPSRTTPPADGALEARDDVEQRALAAPGMPDHRDELTLLDLEIHVTEDAHLASALQRREELGHVIDLEA